jgi:peptidoglycan DL-endopeptidase CwlO
MTHDGSASITLAVGAAALLLIVILIGAAAGITGQQAAACQVQPAASAAAASIPARYLADYQKAGARYGIPWTVLAGIGTVESDNGQSTAPGVHSGTNPFGAAGPMQFGTGGAAGDTWGGAPVHPATERTSGYGIDGDGDGVVDVYDPGDAIPSAAWFLQAHDAQGDLEAALFAFNHSAAYVSDVLSWAARYSSGGVQAVSAASSPQCQLAAAGPQPAGTAGTVIAYAEAQLGKPYQYGATGPDAFDCSGLAMMAYRAAGITIPRTSQAQWAYGTQIPASQVRPGDLVFFAGSDGTPASPGHVGIVLNPAVHTMIDAYETGYPVEEDTYGLPASKGGLSPVVGFTRPRDLPTGRARRLAGSPGQAGLGVRQAYPAALQVTEGLLSRGRSLRVFRRPASAR